MFLSAREVANITGRGIETVRRWITEKKLKAVKINNHYMIEKESLLKMLENDNSNDSETIKEYLETINKRLK